MAICLCILCLLGERAAEARQTYRSGRAAAAAANIAQLIQAYTAEYTCIYRQIQSYTSRYEFHIKSYVTVCHAEIQADTDNRTAISDHIGMYAVPYLLPHTSRYNQIQANLRNLYIHICMYVHVSDIKIQDIQAHMSY